MFAYPLSAAIGALGVCILLVVAFIWACGEVSHDEEAERDDHELYLSVEGARRREAAARSGAAPGGAVPAVSARQPGPRDPVLGVDQARHEVRERVQRYNAREVR